MKATLRSLVLLLSLSNVPFALQAQILFVNDNDNILFNTDTVLSDLTAAGIAYDVYNVAEQGAPPSLSLMYDYPAVIWYCSGDGVGLGLWQAEADLQDLANGGVPIWFIGTDMLYAGFGATPLTFSDTDLPFTTMGLASYDVQSYGDDGSTGCAQLDVDPGVAAAFEPSLHWVFSTFWWLDGVTPRPDDVDVIYAMGPNTYALYGHPSMVFDHANGSKVMSSFFDPALIDTYEKRILFFSETLDYIDVSTGIATLPRSGDAGLRVRWDGADGAFIEADGILRSVAVYDAEGRLVNGVSAAGTSRWHMEPQGRAPGLFLIVAVAQDGTRLSTKWVRP